MPFFESQGVRLHFQTFGNPTGEPVLLLHGFASDLELNWVGSGWVDALVKSGRLVAALDFRGHGQSDKPHRAIDYDRIVMAADVGSLLQHLDLAVADVIGYSMGAQIALRLLIESQSQVDHAVLGGYDGSPRIQTAAIARRLRSAQPDSDPAIEYFHRFAASKANNDLEALACCIEGHHQTPSAAEMAQVTRPVLVVAGDQDPLAPTASKFATRLAGARFISLPGRDHMRAVVSRDFRLATIEFLAEP
ncbi:MAG: alpha/beta fold hydrolase [Candidatus Dormibacteraceae bacterium]